MKQFIAEKEKQLREFVEQLKSELGAERVEIGARSTEYSTGSHIEVTFMSTMEIPQKNNGSCQK